MASANDQDPKQFEKDLIKYEVFGEDSSDEEDDVSTYDVEQKLSDFEKVKNNFPGFIHKKLSFIIYAVAIKCLYSSDIQKAYYKKKLLNNSSLSSFNEVCDGESIFSADNESDVFESIHFFSRLHLHNRLAKKRMIFEPISSGESSQKTFKWKYSNRNTVFVLNKYNFNDVKTEYVVFDSKTDTKYDNLWKECKIQLGDVRKLRIFTNGMRKENLSYFAAKFHCLLFGLEVMRNPSALIHHIMLFDLIERGKIRWEEVHKKMPMALEDVVEASRYKNSVYSAYMPHHYLYDVERDISYQSDTESELLERELDLTKNWLENNHSKINEEGDIKDEYVGWFFMKLQNACKAFYNIEAF